jgi:tetratricopeptide (TPR) repeat protein
MLEAHDLDDAIADAKQALALAPEAAQRNSLMGDILAAEGNLGDALGYYRKALHPAQTVQLDFQIAEVAELEKKIASFQPKLQ